MQMKLAYKYTLGFGSLVIYQKKRKILSKEKPLYYFDKKIAL